MDKITITQELVKRTLNDNVDGFKFESFIQEFFSAITENKYKPVGGVHDGGADGIMEDQGLYEEESKNASFMQVSIQKTTKSKIIGTIKRLKDYGRDVKRLVYFTSIIVPDMDKIEDDIYDNHAIRLSIRDANYIAVNINYSHQTATAFRHNLLETYDFLRHIGHSSLIIEDKTNKNLPFLFSFIQRELDNKKSSENLLNSLTDSLILWALEETDPDKKIVMDEKQILERILDTLPTSSTFIKSTLKHRLDVLHNMRTEHRREKIQFIKKLKGYCLPYETRNDIIQSNIKDEELFENIKQIILNKIIEVDESIEEPERKQLMSVLFTVLHYTFEEEGLEFASFIKDGNSDIIKKPIVHNIDRAFSEINYIGKKETGRETIRTVISYFFYQKDSSAIQTYLNKLSETYALLLSLKADGRVVEYFQKMSSEFSLIVGTDIIITALSEILLDVPNQSTTNLLRILTDSKSSLQITEHIVEEVWHHITNTDFEYKNYYRAVDAYMKIEFARESSKILIRAFYYNKLLNKYSKTTLWSQFMDKFCDYDKLHAAQGREQLKKYLINKFGFVMVEEDVIARITESKAVNKLKQELIEHKKNTELATHASILVNLIYLIRKNNKENMSGNTFGYNTWWLTSEKTTMQFTNNLVKENNGYYIIRPEFLMHYISLMPSLKDVKKTYKDIFPTILGIRMSGRIAQEELHRMLNELEKVSKDDPARLTVKTDDLINKLKGDFIKEYDFQDDLY